MRTRRKNFFSASLVVYLLCLISCHHKTVVKQEEQPIFARTALIVDNQGHISEAVRDLMRTTGLEPVFSLKDAIEPTQKLWIRKKGLEHAHLSETRLNSRDYIIEKLEGLGFLEMVLPTKKEYDYVLLLGAMYETYKARLLFLEDLVKRGIKVNNIALLGALRPLEPVHELNPMVRDAIFDKLPINEIEMMESLYKQTSLAAITPIKIASSMKQDAGGKLVRANTFDTVIDFMKLGNKPGSVLVISNQPYVVRQGLIVASVLKSPWEIETVGLKPKANIPTDVYLDELARVLFEINKVVNP